MSNDIAYIYTLSDPITNDIRYVGKTIDIKKRLIDHLNKITNCHKSSWIKCLKKEGLIPKIEIIDFCDESNWRFIGSYWIEQCKAWGFNLTNLKDGGFGQYSMSPETREKLSKASTGKKQSSDTILKRIKTNTGKKRTKQTCINISNSLKGKKFSEKAKEKRLEVFNDPVKKVERIEKFKNKMRGRKLTIDHKMKISIGNKGKKRSEEIKKKFKIVQQNVKNDPVKYSNKISKLRKQGEYHTSEETKQKLRDFNLGKKMTEETKNKIRDSHLNTLRGNEKMVLNEYNGIYYDSVREAWRAYNGLLGYEGFLRNIFKANKNKTNYISI